MTIGAPKLQLAVREARIASAERTGVMLELHDAERARLEILQDALAPLFAEVPAGIDLFDPGLSIGDTPRLWIDAIAHVVMGRDRRTYRFLQDTRFGRKVRAETPDITVAVAAVTQYVAQRLVERERALAGERPDPAIEPAWRARQRRRRRLRAAGLVGLGILIGAAAVLALAFLATLGLTAG